MKILLSGSSGFIGGSLLPELAQEGHSVVRLKTNGAPGAGIIPWQPLETLAPEKVSGFDAVIHLAGENVYGRWSAAKKQAIYDSRVVGTRNLCAALVATVRRPRVLLAASAVGYYGAQHRNEDHFLTEDSPPGEDFLARLCRDWEAATTPAAQAGIRAVTLRFGIVLSKAGGALKKMLPPFQLGLCGPLGSGKQWMSWIAIQDAVEAIVFCLKNEAIRGPVNLVAPNPVTNAEFARTLAKAVHRPALMRVPAFVPKLLFGKEMAENTVLASQRATPEKLLANNFRFSLAELSAALQELSQG